MSGGSRTARRSVAAGLGALVAAASLGGAPATASEAQAAATKFRQPTCAKERAKVRKAKGAKKRTAAAALRQCTANLAVHRQVVDSHLLGVRTDGVEVDTIYCADGKWQDDARRGGTVRTGGWRVIDAKVTRGGFTATVEAYIPGGRHVQAVVKDGDRWKVGYEWNGEARNAGDVERTDARSVCATL